MSTVWSGSISIKGNKMGIWEMVGCREGMLEDLVVGSSEAEGTSEDTAVGCALTEGH